jgi:hypothetical protein
MRLRAVDLKLNSVDFGVEDSTLQRKSHLYMFPEKEFRGISPNSHIHVAVSDLYIPRIGPPTYIPAAE